MQQEIEFQWCLLESRVRRGMWFEFGCPIFPAAKKATREYQCLHIFGISSSSRHEKYFSNII
jgi:hypothetical protein